jgi:hypothetical protein
VLRKDERKVGGFGTRRFCRLCNTPRDLFSDGKDTDMDGEWTGKQASLSQNVRLNMGRRSKAAQSRLQSLGQPPKSQKARVDDVTDSEDEGDSSPDHLDAAVNVPIEKDYGFIVFEDYESDSDDDHIPGPSDSEETESNFEDEDDQEIKDDADLLRFSAILTEAQRVAVKLEQDSEKPKRPKHYTGNAPRTKRFHAQKRRTLAAEGQKFISQFFPGRANLPQPTVSLPDTSGYESDDEESLIDINEHLDRIFGPEDVRMASPSDDLTPESDFYSVSL